MLSSFSLRVSLSRDVVEGLLELELVGDLAGDVLEADAGPRDALEPDPVEAEPGQLAHLDLPLDEGVGVGVAVHAQQEEALALLVVAVVSVEDLKEDFELYIFRGNGLESLKRVSSTISLNV